MRNILRNRPDEFLETEIYWQNVQLILGAIENPLALVEISPGALVTYSAVLNADLSKSVTGSNSDMASP